MYLVENTILDAHTFRLNGNDNENTQDVFSSKTLFKEETFENATNEIQCKC